MQQQHMGEFMVLHAETNATSANASSTRGQQVPIAAPTSTDEAKQEESPQHHQENGEKQAALAREYGVTRTTICHIKKNHRNEIITRYDLLVKQAQEIDRAENVSDQSRGGSGAGAPLELRAAIILMTTLRDYRTSPAAFRRAAGRLWFCFGL
ncbi:hypothetical protein PF010_g22310 [Phytophthora fragariae]|nr:hypothetical protein PF010_g22310 [Phytophthora fragariae]KAE9101437.1 hypothetical protein PF006_g22675 [Phytophthora fragariae]KAE9191759.1 hypothetical protein PF002_g24406 [Phytophthora fragariae]KAE9283418.1 hypothetical protein PF001_g22856 [Phytophthora fragariae]